MMDCYKINGDELDDMDKGDLENILKFTAKQNRDGLLYKLFVCGDFTLKNYKENIDRIIDEFAICEDDFNMCNLLPLLVKDVENIYLARSPIFLDDLIIQMGNNYNHEKDKFNISEALIKMNGVKSEELGVSISSDNKIEVYLKDQRKFLMLRLTSPHLNTFFDNEFLRAIKYTLFKGILVHVLNRRYPNNSFLRKVDLVKWLTIRRVEKRVNAQMSSLKWCLSPIYTSGE